MRIRWIRGFFRVWLLASVAWVIGAFFWFLWDGMQTQCMFGDPPGAAEGATWRRELRWVRKAWAMPSQAYLNEASSDGDFILR